jgi:hypothetical protein
MKSNSNRADRHLCRQAKLRSDVVVHQLLQLDLVRHVVRVRHARNDVAGTVERFQRAQQCGVLLRRGDQLDEQRLFHTSSLLAWSRMVNGTVPPSSGGAVLPTPEGGGILRRFW